MALVGNGAELEADEVPAGGERGHCPWSQEGMAKVPPPWSYLGRAASRPEESAGAAGGSLGGLSPRE